jgi:hypothetical protein
VGAAVFIADKVSGGAVDRLGSYQYEVKGPWADPDIRRLGAWTRSDRSGFLQDQGGTGAPPPGETEPAAATAEGADTPRDQASEDRQRDAEVNLFLEGH